MSDVFYEAMKKEGLFSIDSAREISYSRLLHDMPVMKMDSLSAAYRIANLKRSWPFSQPGNKGGATVDTLKSGSTPPRYGRCRVDGSEPGSADKYEAGDLGRAMGSLYDYYISV